MPMTARPKIGSSLLIVCPPTIAMPASAAISSAPGEDVAEDRRRQCIGEADDARARPAGLPPIA